MDLSWFLQDEKEKQESLVEVLVYGKSKGSKVGKNKEWGKGLVSNWRLTTFKATFEPEVSVWLDWVDLSVKPFSTTRIHYLGVSYFHIKSKTDTDMRKYFAFHSCAKHSLHSNTDNLSAHLSWTVNHFPGIHWNKFSMHYKVCFWESVS